ncbi:Kctd8 [Symbiodinium natans]|uniref:Kctd8 protein n=1 Tax=Symbiodinium natans TaxID=878477 RepID=A0A812JT53_9DINO|nr:Kctd8 [Symbiodinium natans]
MENDWLPCVVLDYIDSEEIMIEIYTPGSFHCERLGIAGPHRVTLAQLRRRQWEVCRGEVLRVPDGATLTLHEGQRLWIQSRGPGQDEPAGRLELGEGSSFRCIGGSVDNEGVLVYPVTLNQSSGRRRYKLEIESTKTLLVDCINGIPDLPPEVTRQHVVF